MRPSAPRTASRDPPDGIAAMAIGSGSVSPSFPFPRCRSEPVLPHSSGRCGLLPRPTECSLNRCRTPRVSPEAQRQPDDRFAYFFSDKSRSQGERASEALRVPRISRRPTRQPGTPPSSSKSRQVLTAAWPDGEGHLLKNVENLGACGPRGAALPGRSSWSAFQPI